MIRINLLGQKPPKKPSRAVPAGVATTLILLLGSVIVAGGILYLIWKDKNDSIRTTQQQVDNLRREINNLQTTKQQVESLDAQKQVLDRQLKVLDDLRQNRAGGQELLNSLAGTVVKTDAVWLTSMARKGNTLTLEGSAGSVNAVANFITELKRSGYFTKVEISESRQDERSTGVAIFLFTLTAEISPPQNRPAGGPAAVS